MYIGKLFYFILINLLFFTSFNWSISIYFFTLVACNSLLKIRKIGNITVVKKCLIEFSHYIWTYIYIYLYLQELVLFAQLLLLLHLLPTIASCTFYYQLYGSFCCYLDVRGCYCASNRILYIYAFVFILYLFILFAIYICFMYLCI